MYKVKYIIGLMLLPLIFSCKKSAIQLSAFDVQTAKTEYKAGDTVTFKFSGDPDIISFYSGEKGKEYKFKDRTTVAGVLGLEIKTQVLYGTQANNLSLLYSTDFNGLYDTTSVRKATWTDITSRFTLSTAAGGAVGTQTSSGVVNISDLAASGKPIYFAFKYWGDKAPGTTSTQRTWRVYNFNLTNTLPDGSVLNVSTIGTASWLALDFANPANKWAIQTSDPVLAFAPASSLIVSEDWALSKPMFATNVSPDVPTVIKTYLNQLSSYKYVFTTAGTYTVTFVATNGGNDGSGSVVKQLTITVK
ncbi:DUF5017 domain-containing protein [Mucilaginibacter paludis]|uniref:DUF5017 domain-containing protein n=1 Tax=Mucilaginibacter paludis DSM 18603 TaxID=714943 RepID=H1Y6N3_9SPHI|nr:DUF5017 domain-containing protein [Mucilaginibacter paludis]EHQ26825.1 hypothetical protein Mucpa_2713 [Mucilaginibacter paludis DSM 18603]